MRGENVILGIGGSLWMILSCVGAAQFPTLIFLVLKLTSTIAWSWLWVLSPLWIAGGLGILLSIIMLFFFLKNM